MVKCDYDSWIFTLSTVAGTCPSTVPYHIFTKWPWHALTPLTYHSCDWSLNLSFSLFDSWTRSIGSCISLFFDLDSQMFFQKQGYTCPIIDILDKMFTRSMSNSVGPSRSLSVRASLVAILRPCRRPYRWATVGEFNNLLLFILMVKGGKHPVVECKLSFVDAKLHCCCYCGFRFAKLENSGHRFFVLLFFTSLKQVGKPCWDPIRSPNKEDATKRSVFSDSIYRFNFI